MKVLFVLSLLCLVIYSAQLPIAQYVSLHRASTALAEGNFEGAMAFVESARRPWPQFYHNDAATLCADVILARAQHMAGGADPDFGGAASLLQKLHEQCDTTSREADSARVLERVVTLHLAQATDRCAKEDFAMALQDFQRIQALPYPPLIRAQARAEVGWCRLQLANALTRRELYEAALEEFRRLVNGEEGPVREAALKRVPLVIWDEFGYWTERKAFQQAFRQLEKHEKGFEAYPETASLLVDLEKRAEHRVFGGVLAQQCREPTQTQQGKGKPSRPTPQGPAEVITALHASRTNGSSTANLIIQNDTKHRLQVLLRGIEAHAIPLEPGAAQELTVEPAAYAIGVFAPENCRLKSGRSAWTIKDWEPFNVRFYEP